MNNVERAVTERMAYLKEVLRKLENVGIKNKPDGHLRVSSSNGKVRYYQVDGSDFDNNKRGGKYIRKNELYIAKKLAQYEFNVEMEKKVCNEYNILNKLLCDLKNCGPEEYYNSLTYFRKILIDPCIYIDELYRQEWMNEGYEGKDFAEDSPEIITEHGERVRSKSEKMIADKIYSMDIPYKYECPLYLKGYGVVYPDFQLLNVGRRSVVVLEHFGMMDDSEYASKALKKIELYERNGYYPGINLIITHETSERPIDMRIVENLIMSVFDKADQR